MLQTPDHLHLLERRKKRTRGPYRIFGHGRVAIVVQKALLRAADGKTEVQPTVVKFGPRLLALWLRGTWFASAWQPEGLGTPAKRQELAGYFVAREKLITKVGSARLVLGGDHNASLGDCAVIGELRDSGTMGRAPLLETGTPAGQAAMEWAGANDLWIPDTFRHIHKRGTFRATRGQRNWHELDYNFMVSKRVQVARVRAAHPGINTDHRMNDHPGGSTYRSSADYVYMQHRPTTQLPARH